MLRRIVMTKSQNLLEVLFYINNKKIFTARDVSDTFGISIRTAHRYLMDLSNSGVPIYTEQGRNGGYRLLKNSVLPPVTFSIDEGMAIIFAFQNLNNFQSLPFDMNYETVTQKILTLFSDETKRVIENNSKFIEYFSNRMHETKIDLKQIIEASMNNEVIEIKHNSPNKVTIRNVVPIGLYTYNGKWYMPSYDLNISDIRSFRVDRIEYIKKTNNYYETKISIVDWLKNKKRAKKEGDVNLKVEFNAIGIQMGIEYPWIKNNLVYITNNFAILDIMVNESELNYLKKLFISFGKDAKIKAPKKLREDIITELKSIIDYYCD
ncbi:YafY family transcriptional regulator [Lactococcus cremoris]|nr:YafY family transcriptional regulator [Lactococcus cremoris]